MRRRENQTSILKAEEAGVKQQGEDMVPNLNKVEQKEQLRTTLSVFVVYLIAQTKQQELTTSSSVSCL